MPRFPQQAFRAYEYVTMTVSTGRESDKFMLRFPEGMRDRIRAEAEQNNRSMNAEIISRLEASFGMDIHLVRGTVNTVQGMQAAAQQIVNFMQSPEVQAMFEKLAEKGPALIEAPTDDDKPDDSSKKENEK